MAPEQIMSEKAMGPRADLFSLACTLLECLTGQPAFSPEFPAFLSAVTRSPEGVTALGALDATHPSLRIVLERALQASPGMRQRTCADFARELAALGEVRPRVAPRPPTPSPEAARPRSRSPEDTRPVQPAPPRRAVEGGQLIEQRYRVGELVRQDAVYAVHRGEDLATGEPVEVALFDGRASPWRLELQPNLRAHWAALSDRPRPRIQRVLAFGETKAGRPYAIMDDLTGLPTLQEVRARGLMRYTAVRGVIAGVAAALDALSDLRHEVVHPGSIRVIERADHTADVFLPCMELSTAWYESDDPEMVSMFPAALTQYVAPEVLQGAPRGAQAGSVWNLGVLAYVLETNQPPFGHGGIMQVAMRMMNERPRPFASFIVGGHDRAVEEAVFRCLERDPADRYASIADAARALGFEGF
jgi:hypothetical protein